MCVSTPDLCEKIYYSPRTSQGPPRNTGTPILLLPTVFFGGVFGCVELSWIGR